MVHRTNNCDPIPLAAVHFKHEFSYPIRSTSAADHMSARLMIDDRKLDGRASAVDHENVLALDHVRLISKMASVTEASAPG
jgi:hypothetical protein